MATKLETPFPVTQLQVGEVRAKLIGGSPTGWARVAYCTETGTTVGDTTFSAWSKESWQLLLALCEQIEVDLAEWMKNQDSPYSALNQENGIDPDPDMGHGDDLNFGPRG
tara:strand:+ start:3796 stop:4125 length:330 start_codon:yes stop_codon:yes gene_type:complete